MLAKLLAFLKNTVKDLIKDNPFKDKGELHSFDLIEVDGEAVIKTVKLTRGEAQRKNLAFRMNFAKKLYVLSDK